MRPHVDPMNAARDRELRASRAPGDTFKCGCCGNFRQITGRRKMVGIWHCAQCIKAIL